nr:FAD-dependent oxidoreductase [Synechococcus elongatus]
MDWLVIGGGLTGVAIAYELQRQGSQVHLVDPQLPETAALALAMAAHPFGLPPVQRSRMSLLRVGGSMPN